MLFAAFFGMAASAFPQSLWVGLLAGMVGGVLLIDPDPITDLIGLLLIAIPFISQIVQSRKAKAAPAE